MRPLLAATTSVLIAWLAFARPVAAMAPVDLWSSRVGLYLGPQYFLEHDEQVQFSFGAGGDLRLAGPLSLGLVLGVGVIDDMVASGQASLRLHILRNRQLTLGLDVRGGVLVWFGDADSRVEPLLQGGLELVHDLGERFWIGVRAGLGWVPGDDLGTLADLSVGLGFFL